MSLTIAQNTTVYAIGAGGRERRKAFSRALPADWAPQSGEWVWVAALPNTIGSKVATARVKTVAGTCVLVEATYGRTRITEVYDISHVRPMAKRRRKAVPA